MRRDKWYNVLAYENGSRIMKETLNASSGDEAKDIGRTILRGRGFDPSKIRIEVVEVNSGWLKSLGL